MKKLTVTGTPGGEYLLEKKGRVAGGVVGTIGDILRAFHADGYEIAVFDKKAMMSMAVEVTDNALEYAAITGSPK